MGKAIAKRTPTRVGEKQTDLPTLAAKIERWHQATCRTAVWTINNAMRCGDLLIEAKGKVKHGEWLPWLEANTTVSDRQAQKYMRLAEYGRRLRLANANRGRICRRSMRRLPFLPSPRIPHPNQRRRTRTTRTRGRGRLSRHLASAYRHESR